MPSATECALYAAPDVCSCAVLTPTTGKKITQCARGAAADIELALNAAHAAADAWGKTPAAARAGILQKIAAIIRDNNELLAYVESCDNGKPIREALVADIPLAADHFDYFAGSLRAHVRPTSVAWRCSTAHACARRRER